MDTDDRDLEPDMEQDVTEPDEMLSEEPADDEQAGDEPEAGEEAEGGPKAAPSVKPGFFARTIAAISAPFERIHLPAWNLRLFGWVLLVLIIIAFFVMNWAPMRLYFFGLSIDIPRALAIVIFLGIGFLAGWLVRTPSPAPEDEEE